MTAPRDDLYSVPCSSSPETVSDRLTFTSVLDEGQKYRDAIFFRRPRCGVTDTNYIERSVYLEAAKQAWIDYAELIEGIVSGPSSPAERPAA